MSDSLTEFAIDEEHLANLRYLVTKRNDAFILICLVRLAHDDERPWNRANIALHCY